MVAQVAEISFAALLTHTDIFVLLTFFWVLCVDSRSGNNINNSAAAAAAVVLVEKIVGRACSEEKS